MWGLYTTVTPTFGCIDLFGLYKAITQIRVHVSFLFVFYAKWCKMKRLVYLLYSCMKLYISLYIGNRDWQLFFLFCAI